MQRDQQEGFEASERLHETFSMAWLERQMAWLEIDAGCWQAAGLTRAENGSCWSYRVEGMNIQPGVPLHAGQVAFLQWQYHAAAAKHAAIASACASRHDRLAQKWVLIVLAVCSEGHDHQQHINLGKLLFTLRTNFQGTIDFPAQCQRYVCDHYRGCTQISRELARRLYAAWAGAARVPAIDTVSIGITPARGAWATRYTKAASACALAAVACGACMVAMSVCLPGVLGVADHWAMVCVAALSGAAVMGWDAQSHAAWSWMRAVCCVAALCAGSAGAHALSCAVLPCLAAAPAGVSAVVGAGLTLVVLGGLGGLASCVGTEAVGRSAVGRFA